jgi:hypothetical protein
VIWRNEGHGVALIGFASGKNLVYLEPPASNSVEFGKAPILIGAFLERAALFFTTGCSQRSDLWERLGCKRDEKGSIVNDPLSE